MDVASRYRTPERRVHLVRHEPMEEFATLYERLGLSLTPRAQRTIARFTSDQNPGEVAPGNPAVVPLDSRRNVTNWTHRLRPEEIARIRDATAPVWPRYYSDEEWTP